MSSVHIHRGNGSSGFTVKAYAPLPEFRDTNTKTQKEFYDREAKELFDVFHEHLPGGTMDALLAKLLDHRRSLLVIPYGVIEGRETKPTESLEPNAT